MKKMWKKVFVIASLALMALAQTAAAAHVPTSLLTAEVETTITNFAADLMPTVLALIGIIVPVALSLWALGFGIKKGISYLQRRAQRAI